MTAASVITLTRIALIPVFMWACMWEHPASAPLAFSLYLLTSATDAVDGYIARKYNQVTTFGKFIDPLADKLLVTSALLIFLAQGTVAVWVVMVILAREFIITSLRMVAVSKGTVVAAGLSGKIKMWVQSTGILLLLTDLRLVTVIPPVTLGNLTCWILAAVTIWSGVVYLLQNKTVFQESM